MPATVSRLRGRCLGMRLIRLALIAALLAPAAAQAQTEAPEPRTLSVIGRGAVELQPDRGTFTVVVTRRSRGREPARSQANAGSAAIVAALQDAGVARESITTLRVSLDRVRRRTRPGGPKQRFYRAFVALEVSVVGLEPLSRAIDVAARRATAVYGPELFVAPEAEAAGRRESDGLALADARQRAEAAAAVAGQRIVGIQAINLDPDSQEYYPEGAAGGRASEDTDILAARIAFTTTARVTYLIEPV